MAEKNHTQDPLDLEEAMSSSEAFIIKYKTSSWQVSLLSSS